MWKGRQEKIVGQEEMIIVVAETEEEMTGEVATEEMTAEEVIAGKIISVHVVTTIKTKFAGLQIFQCKA